MRSFDNEPGRIKRTYIEINLNKVKLNSFLITYCEIYNKEQSSVPEIQLSND